MSDGGPRERLLAAAQRVMAHTGPHGLQARKVAAEAGTSTMAVYTHFGNMHGVMQELAREGFIHLDRRLAEVSRTEDPVADLFALGMAYREHAFANPQLYCLMFGLDPPGGWSNGARTHDLTELETPTDLPEGQAAFAHLVAALQRAMEAGRLRAEEPLQAAGQVWSAIHGYVLLEIAGCFGPDGHGVGQVLVPLSKNLLVGMGDTPEQTARSLHQATP